MRCYGRAILLIPDTVIPTSRLPASWFIEKMKVNFPKCDKLLSIPDQLAGKVVMFTLSLSVLIINHLNAEDATFVGDLQGIEAAMAQGEGPINVIFDLGDADFIFQRSSKTQLPQLASIDRFDSQVLRGSAAPINLKNLDEIWPKVVNWCSSQAKEYKNACIPVEAKLFETLQTPEWRVRFTSGAYKENARFRYTEIEPMRFFMLARGVLDSTDVGSSKTPQVMVERIVVIPSVSPHHVDQIRQTCSVPAAIVEQDKAFVSSVISVNWLCSNEERRLTSDSVFRFSAEENQNYVCDLSCGSEDDIRNSNSKRFKKINQFFISRRTQKEASARSFEDSRSGRFLRSFDEKYQVAAKAFFAAEFHSVALIQDLIPSLRGLRNIEKKLLQDYINSVLAADVFLAFDHNGIWIIDGKTALEIITQLPAILCLTTDIEAYEKEVTTSQKLVVSFLPKTSQPNLPIKPSAPVIPARARIQKVNSTFVARLLLGEVDAPNADFLASGDYIKFHNAINTSLALDLLKGEGKEAFSTAVLKVELADMRIVVTDQNSRGAIFCRLIEDLLVKNIEKETQSETNRLMSSYQQALTNWQKECDSILAPWNAHNSRLASNWKRQLPHILQHFDDLAKRHKLIQEKIVPKGKVMWKYQGNEFYVSPTGTDKSFIAPSLALLTGSLREGYSSGESFLKFKREIDEEVEEVKNSLETSGRGSRGGVRRGGFAGE